MIIFPVTNMQFLALTNPVSERGTAMREMPPYYGVSVPASDLPDELISFVPNSYQYVSENTPSGLLRSARRSSRASTGTRLSGKTSDRSRWLL